MNLFIVCHGRNRLGVPDKEKEMKRSVRELRDAKDLITIPMLKSSLRELEKTVLIRTFIPIFLFRENKQSTENIIYWFVYLVRK
jgi:hypothetical protein